MDQSQKKCSTCKIEKNREEFNKNCTKRDGLDDLCRGCRSQAHARWYSHGGREVQEQSFKRWYANGGKQVRAKLNMKTRFGDARLKDFLFQYQGGVSALSGLPLLAPAVDHSHATDKVRGLINDLENCCLSWWTNDCIEGAHEALRKLKKQDGVKAQFIRQAIQYLQRTPEQVGVDFTVVGRYASLKRSKREATKLREQNTRNLDAAIARIQEVLEQVA